MGACPLPDAGFSMNDLADDVFHFLEKENIVQADIFGYSMGGYAALVFARNHPQRVGKIATLGTKLDWSPTAAARTAAALNAQKWIEKAPAFVEMLAKLHAPTDWLLLVEAIQKMMAGLAAGAALSMADFAKILCPVKILLGELDNMASVAESQAVAAALPAGRFELLSGVKHPFEQVDVSILAAFLATFFNSE